jgi:hypothetical protein
MSHSLVAADGRTHARVVAVALAAATAVITTSITARVDRATWLEAAKVATPTLAAVFDATRAR